MSLNRDINPTILAGLSYRHGLPCLGLMFLLVQPGCQKLLVPLRGYISLIWHSVYFFLIYAYMRSPKIKAHTDCAPLQAMST